MPVHNGARFLREAVDSVLAQSFRDFELVMIDDCSHDESTEILRSYRDSRFTLLRNDRKLRLPATLNRGLQACRAQLVARLDADDVSLPHWLEEHVEFMQHNVAVGVVGASLLNIDDTGTVTGLTQHALRDELIRLQMTWTNAIEHAGVVYRRELVVNEGGYDEACWCSQDYDLWVRLLPATRFANLPVPAIKKRWCDDSITATRGVEGDEVGHRIAARVLRAYLGKTISHDLAILFRRVLKRSEGLIATEVRASLLVIEDMLQTIRARETGLTFKWFRGVLALAYQRQAEYFHMADPQFSWEMLGRCLSTSCGRTFTPSVAGLVCRLLLKKHILALLSRSDATKDMFKPEE